jgi:hypothetical protein
MKKALICVLLALAAFSAFAQAKKTRVAVFPFEVVRGVVNADEAVFIREDFSNRLAQTGLFELVPRTEVDKLFNQEAAFQLDNLSDAKKTAEYGRVLNADWIMAGRLGKVGSRLALIVTMYTYPDFVQKPGSQIYAPDIDTLVDSIPNMIADIEAGQGNTAPTTAKPVAKAQPKVPEKDLVGVWKGSYTAGQGETALLLTVYEERGAYLATFDFFNLPGRSNSGEGKYTMSVTYDKGREKFYLKAIKWIDRPSGYSYADLDGTITGDVFSGFLTGSKNTFKVVREK